MQEILLQTKSAVGLVEFRIEFLKENTFVGTRTYKITGLDEITIGADNDSDILMMPGDVKVSFHMNESTYFNMAILSDFKSLETTIRIFVNGTWIWSGYVESKKTRYETAKKIMTIVGYDLTRKMLDINPANNPMGYDLDGFKKIMEIVSEPFSLTSLVKYPIINNVISKSTLQARITSSLYNFPEFRANNKFYYGSDCNYSNMAQMIKQILLNYNLIGYLHLDRTMYLFPRFIEYHGGDIYYINRNEWAEFPEFDVIPQMKGMQARLWTGSFPKNDESHYGHKVYGNYIEGDAECESLTIDQPCGWVDGMGMSWSGIFINHNGTMTPVISDAPGHIRRMFNDGSWSDWYYLWPHVVADTWESISKPRKKCKIKLKGSYNKWKPIYYYILNQFDSTIWRAQCFRFNLIENTTEISLREAW